MRKKPLQFIWVNSKIAKNMDEEFSCFVMVHTTRVIFIMDALCGMEGLFTATETCMRVNGELEWHMDSVNFIMKMDSNMKDIG